MNIFLCDIIINNPPTVSSSWKDYLSVVGNVITLGIFFLARYLDKNKERKKKKEVADEKLKYLAALVISTIKTIKYNRDNIVDLSSRIKKEPSKRHLISRKNYYDLQRIVDKLNLEDYYLSYVSYFNKKENLIAEYQRIITSLDTLYEMQNEVYLMSERAVLNDFDRKKVLNNLAEEIDALILQIIDITNQLQMPAGFKVEIADCIANWTKKNVEMNDNFQLYIDNLCKPLYKIINNFTTQNPLSPNEFFVLILKIRKITIELEFVNQSNIDYTKELDAQVVEIDKTIGTLESNSQDLISYLNIKKV